MSRLAACLLALTILSATAPLVVKTASAQVCTGGIALASQAEVDAFACAEITGFLFIGETGGNDITDLSPLSSLTSVGNIFAVRNNPVLTSLAGLENLASVGGTFEVQFNEALASLAGVEGLTTIGAGIEVIGNPTLVSLEGLKGLTSVEGTIFIADNASLESLAGPESLSISGLTVADNNVLESLEGIAGFNSIGFLNLTRNEGLTSLAGLEDTSVRGLQITESSGLSSLAGLESLTSLENLFIRDNIALLSLDGLENLTLIGEDLDIQGNDLLADCACGLVGLVSDGEFTGVEGSVTIEDNAPSGQCNSPDAVLADECAPVATEIIASEGGYALSTVWPNPATHRATLALSVERAQHVTAEVLDLLGRRVTLLFDGPVASGSAQTLAFERGRLAGGLYFVRVRGETFEDVRALTLLP